MRGVGDRAAMTKLPPAASQQVHDFLPPARDCGASLARLITTANHFHFSKGTWAKEGVRGCFHPSCFYLSTVPLVYTYKKSMDTDQSQAPCTTETC